MHNYYNSKSQFIVASRDGLDISTITNNVPTPIVLFGNLHLQVIK